jgi:hypothetical protein
MPKQRSSGERPWWQSGAAIIAEKTDAASPIRLAGSLSIRQQRLGEGQTGHDH